MERGVDITKGTSGTPLNKYEAPPKRPRYFLHRDPALTVGRDEVDAPDSLDLQRPLVPRDKVVEVQEHTVQHAQLGLGRQQQELLALKNCAAETGPDKGLILFQPNQ